MNQSRKRGQLAGREQAWPGQVNLPGHDFVQPGTLVREALDDAARQRLVNNIVGHALNGVTEPVLIRVFDY